MAKILVVEDYQTLSSEIRDELCRQQHVVDVADDGKQAQDYLAIEDYDLLILDWELPGVSGIEICRQYRQKHGQAHVLILTGKSKLDNKEEGLDAGADDYLTKPFEMRELLARVRALLRRTSRYEGDVLTVGPLSLNLKNHRATINGEVVHLRMRELAVLEFLLRHPNEVISADTLLSRVWGTDVEYTLDTVYTCLNRLRKKIKQDNKESLIKNIYGAGYMLDFPQAKDR